MRKLSLTVIAGLVLFMGSGLVSAAEIDTAQKKQIESIIHDYLLEHPEVLREMSERLQAKELAEADVARAENLTRNAAAIFKSGADPVAGNPTGDVTIVEFTDYNCGWCKKSIDEIVQITEGDKNVRIVIKEFPIFGAGSDYAARAALASVKQGKYWELHRALFKQETQVTREVVDAVAESIGLDVKKMQSDMDTDEIKDIIRANHELAKSLKIEGTPAFVIDDKVIPGYVPVTTLNEHVLSVRSNGCKLC
jgi:protein-disulfide isomerase